MPNILSTVHRMMEDYQRALISFVLLNEKSKIYEHIGTGFFCTFNNKLLLITAAHVVDDMKLKSDAYCSILLGDDNKGSSFFDFIPFSNLNFHKYDEFNITYCLVDHNILYKLKETINKLPSNLNLKRTILPLQSEPTENNKSIMEFILGFSASNNLRKSQFQLYKRNWTNIMTSNIDNLPTEIHNLTNVINPVFLSFNRKENKIISDNLLDKNIEFILNLPDAGNHVDLEGMSGSPYIKIYEKDGQLCPRVSGVLVEHLRHSPANGYYLVASPLNNLFNKLKTSSP